MNLLCLVHQNLNTCAMLQNTNSCNTLKEKGHAVSLFRLLASIEETSISTYK